MGKIIDAKDISNKNLVQDGRDLVVTGADVEGLYPSLSDIEVAIIVYEAVMNCGSGLITSTTTRLESMWPCT
jgi:hypothetical protein